MASDRNFAFNQASLLLAPLQASDEPRLQKLCARCAEYLTGTYGLSPAHFGARQVFESLQAPKPGRFLFGVQGARGELIAALDVMKDYALPKEWCVVQLIVDPAYRGRGLGAQIYQAFETWARTQGAQDILLAVSETNAPGFQFWRRLGFETVERAQPMTLGQLRHRMTIMCKFLVPGRKEFLLGVRRR